MDLGSENPGDVNTTSSKGGELLEGSGSEVQGEFITAGATVNNSDINRFALVYKGFQSALSKQGSNHEHTGCGNLLATNRVGVGVGLVVPTIRVVSEVTRVNDSAGTYGNSSYKM